MTTDTKLESLAATFERHADEEGKILAEYRRLAEKLGDSDAGFLVDQILTEEEMHHLLLRTMAKWLRERSLKPRGTIPMQANRAELLRLTQTLRRHEQETIDASDSLKAALSENDLLSTLLEAMVLDSEKHHRLLLAVEEMLKA